MNLKDRFHELNINPQKLTDKKQQTGYKIKYISKYVQLWAIISAKRSDIEEITFIDCMSNAGVYKDGDCCTGIEVLNMFVALAQNNPNKKFNLYLNDYNQDSVALLKKIIALDSFEKLINLKIYISCKDVNEYLDDLYQSKEIFGFGKSVVLYVDPYDFGTVNILKIRKILEQNYCEVIFNFFISDYIRNINRDKERIKRCIGNAAVSSKEDIIAFIKQQFKVGKIKYSFSYRFKTVTNTELYQIVFVTPSIKGLEVLKEALWDVFDGKEFYRNSQNEEQLCLFSVEQEKDIRLNSYATEARTIILDFVKEEKTYDEIEEILMENTMLEKGQIIKYVLKPLIDDGKITKNGDIHKANFKRATYRAV